MFSPLATDRTKARPAQDHRSRARRASLRKAAVSVMEAVQFGQGGYTSGSPAQLPCSGVLEAVAWCVKPAFRS